MKNGGYILVKAPENYTGVLYRGKYAYEHHVVYWGNTGITPIKNETEIHHINRDKTDNRFENLELLTKERHASLHSSEREAATAALSCRFCGNTFVKTIRYIKSKIKINQKNFFCSRSHQVKQQWIDNPNRFNNEI